MEKITVKTDMDVMTYIRTVNDLASNFFYSDGEYAPHVGMVYAMKQFYDTCVDSDELKAKLADNADNINAVDILVADEDFIHAFNNALVCNDRRLNFANAYIDALKIVDDRKSSVNRAIDMVENVLSGLVEKIMPALSEENLAVVRMMAEQMASGKTFDQTALNVFLKENRLKEIIAQHPNLEKTDKK